ncbi:MAG: Ureidoglycolate lyase [Planctomycetes bacterium ADurb.Bin401]|nr:MAG: Ureidoglycolate lyase [Planctomycetes bacterium ADurb.Bin401]
MKLISYKKENIESFGVLTDKGIVDLKFSFEGFKQILSGGIQAIEKIQSVIDKSTLFINPASVELLAPILNPGKILALAGNYTKHIIEAGMKLGLTASPRQNTVPRPFIKPNTVLNHPNAIIPWPVYSKEIDYELELCIVIGKTAKCVSPDQAKDYIAGYTIANDVSARSVSFKEGRAKRPWDEFYDWLNGKWADGFLPLGPCIVTADEIGDPCNLKMILKVNDEIRQNANSADMIFNVYEIVSFLTHITTLEPGDLIATGTPEGVAMAKGNFLNAGDRIECYIEKIGTLTNTLGPKPENFYEPLK